MARTDLEQLVFTMSADVSKLTKQMEKANGIISTGSRKAAKSANDNFAKMFEAPNVGRAFDKVFDSTRLKVLDSGVARVGLFGSAIEELGGIGIGAAAGIGVLAAALAKAHDAMNFADELSDSAAAAQVGVEALQEYRAAVLAAGGEERDADEALKGFSKTLGDAISGSPKALKWFKALGFTREQLKDMGDVEHALPKVTDAVANLGSEAQRAAFADHLGLRPLLPVIEQGEGALNRLTKEARAAGLVMDEALVRKAGEAHDRVEVLSKVINLQLMSATADLAPVIVGAMQAVADFAKGINSFTKDVKDAIPAIERVNNLAGALNGLGVIRLVFKAEGLDDPKLLGLLRLLNPVEMFKFQGKAALGALGIEGRAAQRAEDMQGLPGRLKSALAGRKIDTSSFGTAYAPPDSSGDTPTIDKAEKDKAAEQRKRFNEEMARLEQAALQELVTDGRSLEDISVFHQALLDLEEQSYNEKLAQQVSDKQITQAQADRLKVANEKLIAEKRSNATFEDYRKIQAELLRQAVDALNAQADIADALASLAKTLDERRAFEFEALKARQEAARKAKVSELENNVELSPEQRRAKLAVFDQQQALDAERQRRSLRGPLQAFAEDLGSDPATRNQEIVVDGLARFGDALTDAVFEAHDFGEALREIGRDLAKQVFREAVDGLIVKPAAQALSGLFGTGQRAAEGAAAGAAMGAGIVTGATTGAGTLYGSIVAACATGAGIIAGAISGAGAVGNAGSMGLSGILAGLPGFASGTNFAPGGLSWVGERGPELMNVPRGAQIIPNHVLGNLASMGVPKFSGGQSINVRLTMDLRGANGDATIQKIAGDAATAAFNKAVAVTNAAAPGRQARYNLLGT